MMIDEINNIIREALTDLEYKIPDNFSVEASIDTNHGDYASNVAMILAKDLKQSPQEIAQSIVAEAISKSTFEHVEVAGPGFINFWLS
ncbi:MAG: Arginine-tRNA ligase, partial [Berkelbacteria bacterium GW2011_GWA2_38_9]